MAKLLLLFTVVPIVELVLLPEVGRRIGTAATLLLILTTGVLGAVLARRQGVAALRHIRAALAAGRIPGTTIVDGVMMLVAGALLVTPSILSDIVGFLCLVPATRRSIRAPLSRTLIRAAGRGMVTVDAQCVDWRDHARPTVRRQKLDHGDGRPPLPASGWAGPGRGWLASNERLRSQP